MHWLSKWPGPEGIPIGPAAGRSLARIRNSEGGTGMDGLLAAAIVVPLLPCPLAPGPHSCRITAAMARVHHLPHRCSLPRR